MRSLFKHLLVFTLIVQTAFPMMAQESRSFLEGSRPKPVQEKIEPIPEPAPVEVQITPKPTRPVKVQVPAAISILREAVKLVPPPEVLSQPASLEAQPLKFDLYEADHQQAIDPKEATRVVKVLSADGRKTSIGTGFIAEGDSGCQYVVTAAHLVDKVIADRISFGSHVGGKVVNIDKLHNIAIIEFQGPFKNGMGEDIESVEPSNEEIKVGDKVTSVAGEGKLDQWVVITSKQYNVKEVRKNYFYTDGGVELRRLGGGAYTSDGRLLGVYVGNFTKNEKDPALNGLQAYVKVSQIMPLLSPPKFAFTYYGGGDKARVVDVDSKTFDEETKADLVLVDFSAVWCGPCQQMVPVLEQLKHVKIVRVDIDKNKGLAAKYGAGEIPHFVLMKNGAVKETLTGLQTLSHLQGLVDKYAEPKVEMSMSARAWRRQRINEQPSGSIECMKYVDQMFGWYTDYLPQGSKGKMVWSRSGTTDFNLYGKDKAALTIEAICGKTGKIALSVDYGTAPEAKRLPVRDLKFGYQIDKDDITFDLDPVKVLGLAKIADDQLATINYQNEQSKGFIGIFTVLSILSSIRTVYILFHTVADISIPGEISASTYRQDDGTAVIDFEKGKQPVVKIYTLMNFYLSINQVVVNRITKTAVIKFDGTMFAKQYTINLK